jgi:hypothetical protein
MKHVLPLTDQLNILNTGYDKHTTKTKTAHLLYMDEVKLMGTLEEELQKRIQTVRNFSDDIHMECKLDKCAKIVLKKDKLVMRKI